MEECRERDDFVDGNYQDQIGPREEHNLYDRSEPKDVIARLSDEIHRWQTSVKDSVKV